jgi:hypothetical protein
LAYLYHAQIAPSAATPLLDEEIASVSSGKKIHRLVVRKK